MTTGTTGGGVCTVLRDAGAGRIEIWVAARAMDGSKVSRQQRPALVVPPAAVDLEVARREALALESKALHQADGSLVAGLDVGFQAVQPQFTESMLDGQLQPFFHVALPAEVGHGSSSGRALQRAS